MDWMHRVLRMVDHNRCLILSLVLFSILAAGTVGMVGCRSTTLSLRADDGETSERVDRERFAQQARLGQRDLALERAELDAAVAAYNERVAAFNTQVEAGRADLDRQDELRAELLAALGGLASEATAGSLNPTQFVLPGIGLLGMALGLGASGDNRRKDAVIRNLRGTRQAEPATE